MSDREEADRMERLIAANEAAANAMNRLAQILERKERKARDAKVQRVRSTPRSKANITPRAQAAANAALARIGLKD